MLQGTEVLIHQVHVTTYVVKFFIGRRDFKVGSFKPVFHVEFKNRIYSGDQAFIIELYTIFYGQFSQNLPKTVKNHKNSYKLKAWSPEWILYLDSTWKTGLKEPTLKSLRPVKNFTT